MPVKVGKIAEFMEEWAPADTAEEWDNVGLLVGDSSYDVQRILIALDAVNAVIEEAISRNCQMIITHHPLFRTGPKKINDSEVTGRKIIRLIENKIALFSAHTNLDKAEGGVNDELCRKLGIDEFETQKDHDGKNGLMRFAKLAEPQTLRTLAKRYAEILRLSYLPVVGDCERIITKVALVSGNGMSMMKEAVKSGAELFISGDIRYHDANDALEAGIAMLDLTHYASEAIVAEPIKRYLDKRRDEKRLDFEVLVSETDAQPLKTAGL